jgi:hypothetical protein
MNKKLKVALIVTGFAVILLGIVIALLIKNANRIIKYELESFLGKDFSVQRIDLHWGKVEALDISFKNPAGQEIFKTDRLILEANFIGLLKKKYVLSEILLENPYIFLEKDAKGKIMNPFLRIGQKKEAEKSIPSVLFKNIRAKNGSIDFLDRRASGRPVLTKLRQADLEMKDITFPVRDMSSNYTFSAIIIGNQSTGTLNSKGKINLSNKDMDGKFDVKKLDITSLNPYFQQKGDVNVTRGTLDMDMDLRIKSRKIHAPGKAVLRDLEFEKGSGLGNEFLNLPLSTVVTFLKDHNDEIVVNFVVEGDLDNPKFNLRESLMNRISISMAEKLGLSIKRIGESIVETEAEGAKEVGKGIGESIKKLLQR